MRMRLSVGYGTEGGIGRAGVVFEFSRIACCERLAGY